MDTKQESVQVRDSVSRDDLGSVRRRDVVRTSSAGSGVVASRIVWYIVGVIVALLGLRILLYLLGANQGSPFVDFIYNLSGVFAWPFYGIVAQPAYGSSVLDTASLIAIVVYLLVGWGIARLLTLNSDRTV